jgi:hypothetical protein
MSNDYVWYLDGVVRELTKKVQKLETDVLILKEKAKEKEKEYFKTDHLGDTNS